MTRWSLKVFLESGQSYSKITHTIILIYGSGAVRPARRSTSVLRALQGAQRSSTT